LLPRNNSPETGERAIFLALELDRNDWGVRKKGCGRSVLPSDGAKRRASCMHT
jgi:hypothetical protein